MVEPEIVSVAVPSATVKLRLPPLPVSFPLNVSAAAVSMSVCPPILTTPDPARLAIEVLGLMAEISKVPATFTRLLTILPEPVNVNAALESIVVVPMKVLAPVKVSVELLARRNPPLPLITPANVPDDAVNFKVLAPNLTLAKAEDAVKFLISEVILVLLEISNIPATATPEEVEIEPLSIKRRLPPELTVVAPV